MIRIIAFIIFFLSSCSIIQYNDVLPLLRTGIFGVEDIDVNKSFYDSQEFSFLKVNLGRSSVSIFVLAEIRGSDYVWISATKEKLITRNGKIIYLNSDPYSFRFIGLDERFSPIYFQNNSKEYLLELINPKAIFHQDVNFYVVQGSDVFSRFDGVKNAVQVIEEVKTSKLKWHSKNEYWFETDTNEVLASNRKSTPTFRWLG